LKSLKETKRAFKEVAIKVCVWQNRVLFYSRRTDYRKRRRRRRISVALLQTELGPNDRFELKISTTAVPV